METIVFDIGETLVRDDRHWASWADWLGVPPHTVSALVGAAAAQGRDSEDALRLLRPGMDVTEAYGARVAAGRGEHLDETDLYPDVRPVLAELRARGLRVVVAGNRSARAGALLRALDLPADLVVTSEEWGVAAPDPAFFARVLEVAQAPAHATLYVGDHPADDLFPAKAAGLRAAHIRRGPYGYWWADHPDVARLADWHVGALTDLPALLDAERGAPADPSDTHNPADAGEQPSRGPGESAPSDGTPGPTPRVTGLPASRSAGQHTPSANRPNP
ncbi:MULTISPECIES: HAD family hydrolase [unclassified Streptomyces]|uniref:HAD family hydrolase n=1 Tax=unclassified Streptomyces TaxID=2593676 RepID=UPI00081B1AC7|nr:MULTISPECIES: HAD family hydrolase [unclassified Streptomyces]MYQ50053.1 HAD-IA family hydrolase [Streptomyces sp. SID4941]SCD32571.1 haloacid dehalogenase superfamily, subfamily IA, variant 1 with third motif having Dx(3-4)D or Dx(3-4)E [Streptomyces sp. PalvLS-984]SDE13973.1 haloacid dehalogenase superfamily, subfamily IA, variant 1 with third motif having Dx(3-4)D or Dx(3-4)E [Streptomyces sp. AmelKG-A3]